MKSFERPVRVPADVPLSVASPPHARAGERAEWRLCFDLAKRIEAGVQVGVQFHGGRFNKLAWQTIQADDPQGDGFVSCQVGDTQLPLEPAPDDAGSFYFQSPPDGIPTDACVEITLGGSAGAVAPEYALENKFFLLFLPDHTPQPKIPGVRRDPRRRVLSACLIHITGNRKHHLRLIAPSSVAVGEDVRLLIRPEDRWGNVSYEGIGALTLRLNGRKLPAKRQDDAQSTCCWLEGVTLPATGLQRLEVEEIDTRLKATSNPILCNSSAPTRRPLWGMIHAHAELSDGLGTIHHYFEYMRDEVGLDFGALTEHDHLSETPDAFWQQIQATAEKYNQPGHFITFLAFEWAKWVRKGYGDRNVYYLNDQRPIYRSEEADYPHPTDLFRALKDETALIIPHHPASNGNHCDWQDHEPEKERLVEIYSSWGSSERSVNDGNPFPMRPARRGTNLAPDAGEVPTGFVQRALALGWRVGFTGGGDDHYGHPGDNIRIGWPPFQYKAGLMALWANEKSRESIWDALWQRRTYATTGARMIVRFTLNGHEMGSILALDDDPELESARRIEVEVHGTATIQKIEIVRNNQNVYTELCEEKDVAVHWEDQATLATINLPAARWSRRPFTFYYLRITQSDGEMAWASPIWIES